MSTSVIGFFSCKKCHPMILKFFITIEVKVFKFCLLLLNVCQFYFKSTSVFSQ